MNTPPPALVDTLVQDCIEREALVDHLYLDVKGLVTVGVGKLLHSAMEASRLPFRVGDRPATVAEVSLDFVRVAALPVGHVAAWYRSPSAPLLPDGYGASLCKTELLGEYLPGIQRLIPDALALPLPVVRALVTMAYTMGIHGLAGFPHMLDSITMRDYASAALECHIKGATDATNERLRLWFAEASQPPTG